MSSVYCPAHSPTYGTVFRALRFTPNDCLWDDYVQWRYEDYINMLLYHFLYSYLQKNSFEQEYIDPNPKYGDLGRDARNPSGESAELIAASLWECTKDWSHRLSLECLSRGSSTLKSSTKDLDLSAVITLGTARPAPKHFPWDSMVMEGVDASDSNNKTNCDTKALMSCTRGEAGYDLDVAMNYGSATGSPQLLRFITEHIDFLHNPPFSDWESCLTCGTTSALDIVFRMLCSRGDWLLTEGYTYSGALESAKALGLSVAGVKTDHSGLIPEDLDLLLETWDLGKGPKPSVLYTIPSGQNPTGTTQPTERRKAIYQVAERHDLMIIEDDPYFLLQLGEGTSETVHGLEDPISYADYVQRLPRSYLSLDSAGRVIRLETASKILAPGLRCGWMTSCSQLIQKFLNFTEFSTVAPSGPSQLMLYKLLDETWGHRGFLNWLRKLSWQYRQRRDIMLKACKQYLPSDYCDWNVPVIGMFIWIKVDWSKHPSLRSYREPGDDARCALKIEDQIHMRAKNLGVLVSKGSWFSTDQSETTDIYFRITFGAAPEDQLGQAVERFGRALRKEFEPS